MPSYSSCGLSGLERGLELRNVAQLVARPAAAARGCPRSRRARRTPRRSRRPRPRTGRTACPGAAPGGRAATASGPSPAEALLVDVDDDDARIDGPRHGEPQPRVVDDRLELVDEGDVVPAGGVAEKHQHHEQPERDAHQVLLHPPPLVSARAPRAALVTRAGDCATRAGAASVRPPAPVSGLQAAGLRKNSIFTPASSITS